MDKAHVSKDNKIATSTSSSDDEDEHTTTKRFLELHEEQTPPASHSSLTTSSSPLSQEDKDEMSSAAVDLSLYKPSIKSSFEKEKALMELCCRQFLGPSAFNDFRRSSMKRLTSTASTAKDIRPFCVFVITTPRTLCSTAFN